MKKTIVILVTVVLLGFLSKTVYLKYQEYKKVIVHMETQENILDGVTAQPVTVKVDFSKQVAKGSPLVFGGAHTPPITHTDAWKQISEVGVTSIRNDLFIEFTLPRNITVDDYVKNKNDVANVAKWDQKTIGGLQAMFALAKQSGMKTIGIVGYAPRWLTYNGTAFGVPKNWEVFEDIVKKDYKLYRNNLDYLEIWNEPDHRIFLVTDKSNLTKADAYKLIYSHAVKAIKEVDDEINDGRHIPIGAPAESNAKLSNILSSLVSDASLSAKPDFLSFHAYDMPLMNISLEKYKDIDKQYLTGNTPIFVTEWNNEMKGMDDENSKTGNLAISYTGNNLITYLQNGITGANYFGLLPINSKERDTNEKTMGFYRWNNGHAELLPQAKTWRLMSKTLSLGAGPSKVMATDYDPSVNAVGIINNASQKTLTITNTTNSPQLIEMQLNKLNLQKRAVIYIYVASRDYDGSKPIRNEIAEVKNGDLKTRFYMPEQSVAGVIVKQFNDKWFDLFDVIVH